jgi:hypothetical protein
VVAAAIPAALGTLACAVLGVLFVWTTPHVGMAITRWGKWVMTICYVPLVAWGHRRLSSPRTAAGVAHALDHTIGNLVRAGPQDLTTARGRTVEPVTEEGFRCAE